MTARINPRTPTNQALAKYTMAITVMITGVPAHRIRRFEQFGLCLPARSESGQRLFSDSDIKRVMQVAAFEKAGVNLPGIRVILMMTTNPPYPKSRR